MHSENEWKFIVWFKWIFLAALAITAIFAILNWTLWTYLAGGITTALLFFRAALTPKEVVFTEPDHAPTTFLYKVVAITTCLVIMVTVGFSAYYLFKSERSMGIALVTWYLLSTWIMDIVSSKFPTFGPLTRIFIGDWVRAVFLSLPAVLFYFAGMASANNMLIALAFFGLGLVVYFGVRYILYHPD